MIFWLFLLPLLQLHAAQVDPRRLRLTKPKLTSQVYATMLVQVTADITDPVQTTLLLEPTEDASGPEEGPTQTATIGQAEAGVEEERFSRHGSASSRSATIQTSTINQDLMDEFIFTTKIKVQSDALNNLPGILGGVLLALMIAGLLM